MGKNCSRTIIYNFFFLFISIFTSRTAVHVIWYEKARKDVRNVVYLNRGVNHSMNNERWSERMQSKVCCSFEVEYCMRSERKLATHRKIKSNKYTWAKRRLNCVGYVTCKPFYVLLFFLFVFCWVEVKWALSFTCWAYFHFTVAVAAKHSFQ